VIKVLTTGMGETASDFLARTAVPEPAVGVTGLVLATLLVAQVRAARFHPWLYWAAVAMVSVFGTMAADVLHVVLGVSYLVSTVAFGTAVAVLLALWHRTEGTLAIHSITTHRREVFYWATVLATFALGTAAGDLTASTLGLGYLASGVLFAATIAVPAIAHRWWGLKPVLAFWAAYVLTRPLGASFADWLAVPPTAAASTWAPARSAPYSSSSSWSLLLSRASGAATVPPTFLEQLEGLLRTTDDAS
jgi:uncharacterized membrane-anchored protein